jgi:hypothetical protein
MPISDNMRGTSREAFVSQLAYSEHALPIESSFVGYAHEVYDMISASADEHVDRREFTTFVPDGADAWREWDETDASIGRLPARFRGQARRYSVWRSKAALSARRQRVKQ